MALRRSAPHGILRSGFAYDTRTNNYVNTRTGEIVSAAQALRTPRAADVQRFPGAIQFRYEAEQSTFAREKRLTPRFHGDHAIDIIRRQVRRAPKGGSIVVRGEGGTEEYDEEWWSSLPIDPDTLLGMSDDELADFLYGITDEGPEEIEIYIREE